MRRSVMRRPVMRCPAVAVAVVLALVPLGACGRGESSALADVRSGLASVKRGVIELRLAAGAGESPGGRRGEVGWRLTGPFDMSGKPGSLAVADLELTRMLGPTTKRVRFVSTGRQAFVVADGRVQEVQGAAVDGLRLDEQSSSGVAGLHVDDWARGRVTKTALDGGGRRFEARVDALRVFTDVFRLAGVPGPDRTRGEAAERFRKAVRSARMTAEVGTDKLLRSLHVEISFAVAEEARRVLGELGAAHVAVDLRVDRPNQPIPPVHPPDEGP